MLALLQVSCLSPFGPHFVRSNPIHPDLSQAKRTFSWQQCDQVGLLCRLLALRPQAAGRALPYAIGGVAALWQIERVMSFLPFTVWG